MVLLGENNNDQDISGNHYSYCIILNFWWIKRINLFYQNHSPSEGVIVTFTFHKMQAHTPLCFHLDTSNKTNSKIWPWPRLQKWNTFKYTLWLNDKQLCAIFQSGSLSVNLSLTSHTAPGLHRRLLRLPHSAPAFPLLGSSFRLVQVFHDKNQHLYINNNMVRRTMPSTLGQSRILQSKYVNDQSNAPILLMLKSRNLLHKTKRWKLSSVLNNILPLAISI